jgi:CCR4-NOT transcription complex subunit 1
MSVSCGQSPFVLVKVVLSNLSKKNRDSSFESLCLLFAQYGSEVSSFALQALAQGLDLRLTESTHKVKRKLFLDLGCFVAEKGQIDCASCLLPASEEVFYSSGGVNQVFDAFAQSSRSAAVVVVSSLLFSSKTLVRESCLAFLIENQHKVPDHLSFYFSLAPVNVQDSELERFNRRCLDILPPFTSTSFSDLATSFMSNLSISQVIRNAGYSATSSVEDFQHFLLRFQPLRDNDVSAILSTMSSSLRGLSDFHDQSSGRILSSWDESVCGRALAAITPSLNWASIMALLDSQPQFSVTEASVRFIVSVVRAFHSSSGSIFPVRHVYAQSWPNPAHQHAFLRFLVSLRIEGVSFATTPERTTSFVDEPLGANSPWGNADFLERLIQLSTILGAEQHRSLFDEPVRRFPQTILGSLVKIAESTWPPFASDIAISLFQRFIVQLPQSAIFLKTLFSLNPRGFSVLLVSNFRKDPQCLPNVARLAITIREVSTILFVCPAVFAAELAIAAGRAEALSIENWLGNALNERPDKDDLAGCMITSLQSKISDLPAEVVVGVIRAIRSSPRLSQNVQNEAHSFVENNQARFPFLVNELGEFATAPPNSAAVNLPARNFAPNVEELSNSNFQRIYAGELSIEQAIQMLRDMQASSVPFENEVFKCMIHSLLDEYRYFGQYPDRELRVTGHIFGALIEHRVLPTITNNVALKYILESLRRNAHADAARTDVNMFRFGMWALERARSRLREWPQYCALLQQNRQIEQADAELYRYICSCAGAVARSSGPIVVTEEPPATASATRPIAGQQAVRPPIPSPARPPSAQASSAPFAFVASTVNLNRAFGDSPMFGTAMNANSLLEALPPVASPDESERDKIHFIFNNLSLSNIDLKHRELSEVCREVHFPYLSQYLVAKRVAVEANYHGLYVQFMEKFEGNAQKVIFAVVVDTTLQCVRVLLHRDRVGQAASNGGERTMIKNLGSWLGMLTLARNKPLLFEQLDVKGLMTSAFRSGHLFVVIPFVAKLLESCKNSVIFRPPNPWTNAMLGVLAELHPMPNLKLNIKFEVEVLCKNLEVDLSLVRPASILGRPNSDANNLDWSSVDVQGLMSDPTSAVGSISPSTAPVVAGQALTAQMPQLVISATVDLFRQQPALRMYAQTAIRNAIQEMIAPVVERSVTIACITAREMLVKDLAFETDEGRLRHAAHLAVKHLAGSLALVTCKEHLRQSICQNLRNFLMQSQNTVDHAVLEQTVQTIAHENVDIGCAAIEKCAVEKAIQDIDQAVNLLVEDRRQRGRPNDPIFALSRNPSRFLEQLPEALRPNPGGLTHSQAAIYEAFSQPPRPAVAPAAVSLSATSEVIAPPRLTPDDAAMRAFSTFESASSSPEFSSVSSQIRQVIERCTSPSDAANILAKKLLESLSSNQTSASSILARNFTSCLTSCRELSANLSAYVLDWFQRQPDAVRLKKDLILCLKNSNCADLSELDTYLSENLLSPSSAIASFVRSMQAVSSSLFPHSQHASFSFEAFFFFLHVFARLCLQWRLFLCSLNLSICKILLPN